MKGTCLEIGRVTRELRESMFRLLEHCFIGVTWPGFLADLETKDYAVLLWEDQELAGFSTFTLRAETDFRSRSASLLCSGDTLIHPQFWGSSALGKTLVGTALQLHRQSGREALWWLLITSGPRTWGVLPTFFREFHPSPEVSDEQDEHHEPDKPAMTCTECPSDRNSEIHLWLAALCEKRWPGCRDAMNGVIHLPHPQILKPPLNAMPPTRRGDTRLDWYNRVNPGWLQGDEWPSLVCIDDGNLTRAGRRYLADYLDPLNPLDIQPPLIFPISENPGNVSVNP